MVADAHLAWTLWLLGYPEQAAERSEQAIQTARRSEHPHTVAFALGTAAYARSFRGETSRARERAEAGFALADEHGFPFWTAITGVVRGWALAEERSDEGVAAMRRALGVHRACGAKMFLPIMLGLLADRLWRAGRCGEALAALDEAETAVAETEEVVWNAELLRLRGEALWKTSGEAGAEAVERCFRRAVDVARTQSARSLELRATTSLARLLRYQGKEDEARSRLAAIYGWFTEGLETADLCAARALLA